MRKVTFNVRVRPSEHNQTHPSIPWEGYALDLPYYGGPFAVARTLIRGACRGEYAPGPDWRVFRTESGLVVGSARRAGRTRQEAIDNASDLLASLSEEKVKANLESAVVASNSRWMLFGH